MEIDIRDSQSGNVTRIRFSEDGVLKNQDGDRSVSDACDDIYLRSQEDAENLIEALEKAIQLGWFE